MSFINDLDKKVLVFDGSMGRMLMENGLGPGTCPEEWNITHPEIVRSIYKGYMDAGSDVIQTNTFQSHAIKLEEYGLLEKHYEINYQAAKLAKEVAGGKCYVAASIGPLGKLLEPFGELTFEKAYNTFKDQIIAVTEGGADIISLETFTDISELRIALLAAKENCSLPVICSVSYEQNGRTLMGTEPGVCAAILNSMGADLIGTNCSFGPEYMIKIAESYGAIGLPFSIKPNAGLPEIVEGKQHFKQTPEGFACFVPDFLKYGARLVGGCCGTTPEYIAKVAELIKSYQNEYGECSDRKPDVDYITSASSKISFDAVSTASIGRIDASRDGELKAALEAGDMGTVTDACMDLLDEEWDIIFIDIDSLEDKAAMLMEGIVKEAQTYLRQPFIIKSNDLKALEAGLRVYKGRAGYISNNLEAENILGKYGAVDCGGYLTNEN